VNKQMANGHARLDGDLHLSNVCQLKGQTSWKSRMNPAAVAMMSPLRPQEAPDNVPRQIQWYANPFQVTPSTEFPNYN
jgi:hypothetical protein